MQADQNLAWLFIEASFSALKVVLLRFSLGSQWCNWDNNWAGEFSRFWCTCNCVDWDRSSHFLRPTGRSDRFHLFLLVSLPGYVISSFLINLQKLPLLNSSLEIFCNTPNYFMFCNCLFKKLPLKCLTDIEHKGDKTTVIFTWCLALDKKIERIQSFTCNHVSSNKTTLPMSKEVDIVVFVKSNNDES